uniref:Uncharacterized protein n=1 Tax=Arundo donax TaxID=35708 RepID=A0A0A9F6C2_ARUDO
MGKMNPCPCGTHLTGSLKAWRWNHGMRRRAWRQSSTTNGAAWGRAMEALLRSLDWSRGRSNLVSSGLLRWVGYAVVHRPHGRRPKMSNPVMAYLSKGTYKLVRE